MTVELYHDYNTDICAKLLDTSKTFDFIYADIIYEDTDLYWLENSIPLLSDTGVYVVQTDYHSVCEVKSALDSFGLTMINWCIYINDWGGTPKKGFPRKHDDILIYSNGDNYKWNPGAIQIPKVTAGTALDKKGTGLKTPPDVFYDHASFSTIANERVKFEGHNIRWQKPEWLMERLMLPFTDVGDNVLDLFMGSGTLGKVAVSSGRGYVGIESNRHVYSIAKERVLNASV